MPSTGFGRHKMRKICSLVLLVVPLSAYADLPLTIEDLLTAQNRWRLELGAVYANAERTNAQNGQPIQIQTGPTSFINIPTFAGASRENSDTLIFTPGLRYGISGETEVYARSSWLFSSSRSTLGAATQSQTNSQFGDAWLGINHRFINEEGHPALLGFTEIALAEKQNNHTHAAKSALLGFTTYRTTDPLVLAFTAAYRLNRPYTANSSTYQGGDYLLINPSISFAANQIATLSAGFNWRMQQPEMFNGIAQGAVLTRTDFNLGLGYSYDERTTLNATLRGNLSGGNGAEIGINALFKLGDLPKRRSSKELPGVGR